MMLESSAPQEVERAGLGRGWVSEAQESEPQSSSLSLLDGGTPEDLPSSFTPPGAGTEQLCGIPVSPGLQPFTPTHSPCAQGPGGSHLSPTPSPMVGCSSGAGVPCGTSNGAHITLDVTGSVCRLSPAWGRALVQKELVSSSSAPPSPGPHRKPQEMCVR